MTHAIILAAGKGTRLGHLTETRPKPMLDLHGQPLIERIIRHLASCGLRKIGINLCTMGEQIREHLGKGSRLGVEIHYSIESELRGTAGSLPAFRNWLGATESFLVIYGDILTDQPLQPLLDLHHRQSAYATLLVHERQGSNSFLLLDGAGRIVDFVERPDEIERGRLLASGQRFYVNSALQILSRRALDDIAHSAAFDLPRDLYIPRLASEGIFALPLTGRRVAIDSEARYQQALEMLAS
jgi:NDP-sugar pyrophosphorylase family protein